MIDVPLALFLELIFWFFSFLLLYRLKLFLVRYSKSDFLENLPNIIPTVIQESMCVHKSNNPVLVSPKRLIPTLLKINKGPRIISKGEHSFPFVFSN